MQQQPEFDLSDQEQEIVDPPADAAAAALRYAEIGEVVEFHAEGEDLYAIRTGEHDRDFVIQTQAEMRVEREADEELEL